MTITLCKSAALQLHYRTLDLVLRRPGGAVTRRDAGGRDAGVWRRLWVATEIAALIAVSGLAWEIGR